MPRIIKQKKTRKPREIIHTEPLAVGSHKRTLFLLFRRFSSVKHELRVSMGTAGTKFNKTSFKVEIKNLKKKLEDVRNCSHFRFSSDGERLVMTYIRTTESGPLLVYATSKDKKKWQVKDEISKIKTPAVVALGEKKRELGHIFFGDHILRIARPKKDTFEIVEPPRVPYWHFFEGIPFSVVGGVEAGGHFSVFYTAEHTVDIMRDVNLRDEKIGEERLLKIGVATFAKDIPTRLLWQTELPIVEVPIETHGRITVLGVVPVVEKKSIVYRMYVASQDGEMGFIEMPSEVLMDHKDRKQIELKRHEANPILVPTHLDWEVDGAFNPTALHLDGRVHLIYRGAGTDGFSKIGYASSKDGIKIDERLSKPIYTPRYWFETIPEGQTEFSAEVVGSGMTWGGCEDPKVVQIEDRIYMTYVAHTGVWPTRTVLTSISVDDFLNKKWRWSKPMLMSPPGVGSKSVVFMPEKIDGKYVIFHRLWPNIMVDKVDSLEFGEGKQWLTGEHMIRPRKSYWDSRKMSVGATPIKTKDGWLTIYNAVDRMDSSKYKIGAMLLDLKHPEKVISRSRKPILTPQEFYENDGKPGVAYPGGAIDIDGMLHVYYGGGDKVCCVAQIPTDELVWHLLKDSDPHPHITTIGKIS